LPLLYILKYRQSDAKDILEVIKDPDILFREECGHHLDVMAKWLPKKGFKILPKFSDKGYRPGAVGDEADGLITS